MSITKISIITTVYLSNWQEWAGTAVLRVYWS